MIRTRIRPPFAPSAPSAFVCALCVLLLSFAAVLTFGAGNAQAAGYRYWSFWESGGGKWTYATQGPATARPADGAVRGFRFSVSEDSGDAAKPRRTPDFEAVCGDTPAEDGRKRIAVVIDSGTPADAPDGETPPALRAGCARVGEDATAADALAVVAKPLRYNSAALLCAISGYPASGCGDQVSVPGGDGGSEPASKATPTTADSAASEPSGSARADGGGSDGGSNGGGPFVGVFGGLAAVIVLAAAGFWQARRRRG
ncbi:SCO2322 family protein [Streptomyces sp. NPDC126933]|uniref:SCO2322 family protein n=1 Tax=unclassified Streptomyces TaxID=2593676 RepID=UPI0036464BC5